MWSNNNSDANIQDHHYIMTKNPHEMPSSLPEMALEEQSVMTLEHMNIIEQLNQGPEDGN